MGQVIQAISTSSAQQRVCCLSSERRGENAYAASMVNPRFLLKIVACSNPEESLAARYNLCDMTEADKWIRLAAARCQDCLSQEDICRDAPQLIVHMYLAKLDGVNWQANLLSIKAFLLTQDLGRTRLWVWTDEVDHVVTAQTKTFFDTFADVVLVKQLTWQDEIEGTPLSTHKYFRNSTQLKIDFGDYIAGYADLVRHVLLYSYGGLWIDTDVLPRARNMAKILIAALVILVVQGCLTAANGESVKGKRSLLADGLDYDTVFAASGPATQPSQSYAPPPPVHLAGVASSNTTNTTVSKNATLPAVRTVIAFSGFANAAAFDTTAQNNYKKAIVDALEGNGFNVEVTINSVTTGSVLVDSTTTFLDGSTTGAQAFSAALADSNSVAALFPSSTYGTVTVKENHVTSVKNSSGATQMGLSALAAVLVALTFGAVVL